MLSRVAQPVEQGHAERGHRPATPPCVAGSSPAAHVRPLPDYLERALREASADARLARVFARFSELWEATMTDEIARGAHTGTARSARWWRRKFTELRYMAERETPHGDEVEL